MKKIKSLAVIKESYFILSHSFQIITKYLLTQFFSCRWFMQNLHHAYTISFLFTRIRDRLAEKEVVLFRSVGVAALVDLLILCNCTHWQTWWERIFLCIIIFSLSTCIFQNSMYFDNLLHTKVTLNNTCSINNENLAIFIQLYH